MQFRKAITVLLFILPLAATAQEKDITGLWKGTLFNDTTQKYYKYEIGIRKGKKRQIQRLFAYLVPETGNLDPANAARVLALLAERIRQAGAIGILVTHSREAAAAADRLLHLTAAGLQA